MDPRSAPDVIARTTALDPLASAASRAVDAAVGRDGTAKDALSGRWLGHAAHPFFTDLPIGFWTSTFVLDFVPTAWARRASDFLLAAGNLAAVPTIATGLSELADAPRPAQRVAVVHAVANSIAVGCYLASSVARWRGRRLKGIGLGLAGATAATAGGYLGGHLVDMVTIRRD